MGLMASGVGLGAFGAHALKKRFDTRQLEIWHTAVLYHFIHALGLIFASVKNAKLASNFFFAGICIFSGSLYLLTLLNKPWMGAITPIGGFCFIIGWICLAYFY